MNSFVLVLHICLLVLFYFYEIILLFCKVYLFLCHWSLELLPRFLSRFLMMCIYIFCHNLSLLFRTQLINIFLRTKSNRIISNINFKHKRIFFSKSFRRMNDIDNSLNELIYLPLFLFFRSAKSLLKSFFHLHFLQSKCLLFNSTRQFRTSNSLIKMWNNFMHQSLCLYFLLTLLYFLLSLHFRMNIHFIQIIFQKYNLNFLILHLLYQVKSKNLYISFLINNKLQKFLVNRFMQKRVVTETQFSQKRQFLKTKQWSTLMYFIMRNIQWFESIKLCNLIHFCQFVMTYIQRL